MNNKLVYSKEAKRFEEALPIGNGRLGAMVYGGRKKERISLNIDELWSGKPGEKERPGAFLAFQKAKSLVKEGKISEAETVIESGFACDSVDTYLPLGDIEIEYSGISGEYKRILDLENGFVSVICGESRRTYFASFPDNCIYVRIENISEMTVKLKTKLLHSAFTQENRIIIKGRCPEVMVSAQKSATGEPVCKYTDEGLIFLSALEAQTDGSITASDCEIKIENAAFVQLVFTAETNFSVYGKLSDEEWYTLAQLNCSRKKSADALGRHIKDYSALYLRTKLDLEYDAPETDTDKRLLSEEKDIGLIELLFNYSKYLLISSSRGEGLPANLQGIWNEELYAPWNSDFTTNINLQMNYWSALMCGLGECYIPLIKFVERLRENGAKTAKEMYNSRGFVCHHNSDLWGKTKPVGAGFCGSGRYGFWNMASGWLCRSIYEYFEYTQDEEYLRETAYPIIKDAVLFYLDNLEEIDGRAALTPSTSPENSYILNGEGRYLAAWTAMTQSILYDLFEICIRCCDILSADAELQKKLSELIPKLKPLVIGSHGEILEWDREYEEADVHHRHVSHLYAAYPGEQITPEKNPELSKAVINTLNRRGDDGTGWSLSWKANLWASMGDGEHAMKLIWRQLEYADPDNQVSWQHGGTYINMLDAHPPFQIDGNFGVAAAICRLFVQSTADCIKILPALPSELPSGKISGICTKGNVIADVIWKDKKVKMVTLLSKETKTVKLMINGSINECRLEAGKKFVLVF